MELLLGIDLGTASSKGVLATPDGEVVATASRAHSMSVPHPGWAEVDAEAVWWNDVVELSRELAEEVGDGRVAGICVSGVGPCLLLCDEGLRPLRPAILYGIDMRATDEIEELTASLDADRILQRCGKALSSQAVGPKMRWVQRHEPQVWERATRWYNANTFVAARLTGAYVMDHHTASQSDPLYDLREFGWAEDWAEEVAPGLTMPDLVWPADPVGVVTAEAAAATGLPEGTPVCAGTIDAWAEAFSAGVRKPGDMMLMYGSTMFFVQVLEGFQAHPGLWTTAGVEPATRTLAAGMATSGSITAWIEELTGSPGFDRLVDEASKLPPGADGLVMLPYFAGERTPIFDPMARGLVLGLTLQHGRGHLFRAAYEGIAYGIRQNLELFEAEAGQPGRLVAVGGGTQGGVWTQVVSDVTGRAQEVPAVTIGASYGDALLAGMGTGLVARDVDWARIDRRVEPDPETAGLYDRIFDIYEDLYRQTSDHMHRLAEIQHEIAGGQP